MAAPPVDSRSLCDLAVPRRNRYFYGKLLDADHFELETDYLNAKRWLLNRLVTGYGVVCGLAVEAVPDRHAIVLHPGVAIDKHGREVIVPDCTPPIHIPEHFGKRPQYDDGEKDEDGEKYNDREKYREEEEGDRVIHVLLCYHECAVEPAPVMVGGCHEPEPCEAGVVLERYKVLFRPGCVPKTGADLRIPDVFSGRDLQSLNLDYDRLVEVISEGCPCCPDDPCIPLAELRFSDEGHCHQDLVDITVRPIVLGNDLLFQLLLSMMTEAPSYRREK